ncbi:MAG: iron-containing alcohol dehydrogenase [Candidatus Lokiarchaeota archaeon]|nr:iron-containing alcohol dehydrogenase [Candidatus Harpocratesius repetitus]
MKFLTILYRIRHIIFLGAIKIIKFPNPDLISGENAIEQLAERVKSDGLKKVLVVTDANLHQLGLLDSLKAALSTHNVNFAVFDDVQPNPTIENIENAYSMYTKEKCDGFIAFGGGSPMDCAKVAACRVVKPKKSVVKMRGQFTILKKLPPFYAVPTTAGTGSETTAAAVVSNPKTHEKFAIVDLNIIPHVAVLDPRLMVGLPPFITATTGMDALTHAVEASIGWHSTKYIRGFAEKATKLIFENIEEVYQNGSNLEARNNMALAAFYAGVAFTRASVGYVHAIAHNLGGLYGVPHGLANAVVLPYVLEAFGEKAYKKLAKLAVAGGLIKSYTTPKEGAEIFIQKVKDLNKNMGIPTYIKELQEKDFALLAERAAKEGNPAYPVPKILYPDDFIEILHLIKPPQE